MSTDAWPRRIVGKPFECRVGKHTYFSRPHAGQENGTRALTPIGYFPFADVLSNQGAGLRVKVVITGTQDQGTGSGNRAVTVPLKLLIFASPSRNVGTKTFRRITHHRLSGPGLHRFQICCTPRVSMWVWNMSRG